VEEFASAVSLHPVTAHATGEVIGQVAERLGKRPDLAVLVTSPGHAGALEDAARTVRRLIDPSVLIGCASTCVVSDDSVVPVGPAIALWAGNVGPVRPLRLAPDREGPLPGLPPADGPGAAGRAIVVLSDMASLPASRCAPSLATAWPGVATVGGSVSSVGRATLVLDDAVFRSGAVGVVIGPGADVRTLVARGWRAIGTPLAVTRAEGRVVYELDGRPALARLLEIASDQVPAGDVELINRGLYLGPARSPAVTAWPESAMLGVLGTERAVGSLALDGSIPPTAVVQFHVRDPAAVAGEIGRALTSGADAALIWPDPSQAVTLGARAEHPDSFGWSEGHPLPPLAGCAVSEVLDATGPAAAGIRDGVGLATFGVMNSR
jgi:small ligand-binding sensory domain FIST